MITIQEFLNQLVQQRDLLPVKAFVYYDKYDNDRMDEASHINSDFKLKSLKTFLTESSFKNMEKYKPEIIEFVSIIDTLINCIKQLTKDEIRGFIQGANSQEFPISDRISLVLVFSDEKYYAYYNQMHNKIYFNIAQLFLSNNMDIINIAVEELARSASIRLEPEIIDKIKSLYSHKLLSLTKNINAKLSQLSKDDQDVKKQYEILHKSRRKDPEEFDASGASMAFVVKLQTQMHPELIDVMKQWLKNGYKIENTPDLLRSYKEDMSIWKESPKLWRRFLDRMYNLLYYNKTS